MKDRLRQRFPHPIRRPYPENHGATKAHRHHNDYRPGRESSDVASQSPQPAKSVRIPFPVHAGNRSNPRPPDRWPETGLSASESDRTMKWQPARYPGPSGREDPCRCSCRTRAGNWQEGPPQAPRRWPAAAGDLDRAPRSGAVDRAPGHSATADTGRQTDHRHPLRTRTTNRWRMAGGTAAGNALAAPELPA